jgi:alanine dehydrogenase
MSFNIIGIPKELKNNEKRVIFNPFEVKKLIDMGFKVNIQKNAGILSNYSNKEYEKIGAIIYETIEEIYKESNIIFKVKEPQEYEYKLIKENHCIVGFFHFAGNEILKNVMLKSKACCIALESVKVNNDYPILKEMSILAGKNALNISYDFHNTNIFNKKLVIIGLGNVGHAALYESISLNFNDIHVIDTNYNKLNNIKMINNSIKIYEYNETNLINIMKNADIVIGSIYVNVKKTNKIITDELLDLMHDNSIFVDVSIDQGGMTTQSKPKTIEYPYNIYNNNKYIYCVPNIPSLSGNTATNILSTIVYRCFSDILNKVITINKSFTELIVEDVNLKSAININNGVILNDNIK